MKRCWQYATTPHLTTSAERVTSKHKHNTMSKRHTDSTSDENPRKRRKLSAGEVLVEAARKGETTAVRAGLEKFTSDIASKTVAFDAVHEACRGNHDECLALLLPYVETTQMGFGILLSECVHADHTACTEVLLQHWKSHFASSSGALDDVKLLVGVTENAGHTCLTAAATNGHTETVRYLVGLKEVEVDHTDDEDGTALHWAAENNHADVVQVLIDAGADIEVRNNGGNSPLHFACSSGSLDVVKLLVRAGAGVCVTDNDGDTCLMFAACNGHTETVRYLVGLPEVEVDHADGEGRTALHLVAGYHADVVQVLIDAGANIEARDNSGYSPLHFACSSGSPDSVKMLVRAGAGVRVTNNYGDTCLIFAASRGHTEIVRYLVGLKEVEVDHTDDEDGTALHWAADNNHADVVQVLIDAGANIEVRDNNGYSPLLWSCSSGSLDVAKLLVRAGARVRVTDNGGHTCLEIATSNGHTETVRYLIRLQQVEVDHNP